MNAPERLFERYLAERGLTFHYEPAVEGTDKRPDYRLTDPWSHVLCEVKGIQSSKADVALPTCGFADPYAAIRAKISEAKDKFKGLKGQYCCVLVIRDEGKPLVSLAPQFVVGAMYGNLGFSIPVGPDAPIDPVVTPVFLGGASLQESKNTTVSAIVTLHHHTDVGSAAIAKEASKQVGDVPEQVRRLRDIREKVVEYMGAYDRIKATGQFPCEDVVRTDVFRNVHAVVQFPEGLFRGPFDRHFAITSAGVACTYSGPRVAELGLD